MMKIAIVLAVLAFGSVSAEPRQLFFSGNVNLDAPDVDVDFKWAAWKDLFDVSYDSDKEEELAFWNFKANEEIIQSHNSQDGVTFTLGHNEFSGMNWEEFSSKYVGGYGVNPALRRQRNFNYDLKNQVDDAPASIDWVTKGGVTPVKNQGQCGSCWAFSTTGSLEGDYFVEQGQLVSFSEQNLVSCDKDQDEGCQGGMMDNAFKYIEQNGICTEADYPYTSGTGITGVCKTTCTPAATITGFQDVPQNDEDSLKVAAAQQPVSVAIEADKSVFQLYKSGVLDSASCGTNLDHGVLVVGYGTESGTDYWKVKNSWGGSWGMEGYVLLARGKNMCGISLSASYPTGAKPSSGPGPTPSPSPGPSPPPPTPGSTHYGDPLQGSCMSDEVNITIQGVTGAVCSPECTGVIIKSKCPTDVPTGCTASPTCALEDSSSGKKYCALMCSADTEITEDENDMCGPATCKVVPSAGVGVCTYDS